MAKKNSMQRLRHIHEGDAAPANCPARGVPASEFTELKPEKKGLFSDKNGNAYIIMYSTVMVVIVATLLALARWGSRNASTRTNSTRRSTPSPRVAVGR